MIRKDKKYHVVCKNNKTGIKTYMSQVNNPMTHEEACTFRGKMMQRIDDFNYQLEEATPDL